MLSNHLEHHPSLVGHVKSHVCSFELAKKLKDLGVRQYSIVYWFISETGDKHITIVRPYVFDLSEIKDKNEFSAFTSGEIDEILPWEIVDEEHGSYQLTILKLEGVYRVSYDQYCNPRISYFYESFTDKNEANAKAKMLIFLIEEKLLKGI